MLVACQLVGYIVGNKAKGPFSKRMFQKNKARQIFRKVNISHSLISACTCAYHGVRNVHFSENLACFVFFKQPFWNSTFYLITDDIVDWMRNYIWDVSRDLVPSVLYNLTNVKNAYRGMLLLVKLHACWSLQLYKNNTPPWVLFTFLKLHRRYRRIFFQ